MKEIKAVYREALLDMAVRFGQTSQAEKLKVGCLIYKNDSVIALGCNGQPPDWHTEVCEDDQGMTLPTVRHAEVAALEKLLNSHETAKDSVMFISHSPCKNCAIKIASAGIKAVYYRNLYRCDGGIVYLSSRNIPCYHYPEVDHVD